MSEELLKLGEDDVDASVRFARTFMTRVARCLKTSTMHRMDNAAMQPPLTGLLETVREGMEESPQLVLQMLDDNFFLNREIIKLDFTSYEAGHMLQGLLGRIGAQEIAFTGPINDAELRTFVGAYQAFTQSPNPVGILTQKFANVSVRAIPQAELERLKPKVDAKQNVVRAYANLGLVIGQQLEQMRAKRQVRLAKVRRAIHEIHDAAAGHESLLIGMTRLDAYAGQVRFHLAAVTAMAVLMARRLHMPRAKLADACMSAAFHDIGLDELPAATEVVTQDELDALERVPLKTILRLTEGAMGGDALERIAVAWEHGQRVPAGPLGFGQLVAVPCVFDRLTRPAPPRRVTLPDEALRLIMTQAGTRFDPRVVRLFVSVVGLFPVGTAVRLNSGELGYVVEAPTDAASFARPRVQVLKSPAGPANYQLDLAASGESRFIVGSVDPAELQGANVMEFLLG